MAQTLKVSGTVPTQPSGSPTPVNAVVVPSGATSVVLNVTVVRPATRGFISIRPDDATGVPATSNINWGASSPNIANSVTVQLPTAGTINIFVQGTVGEVEHPDLLPDAVGAIDITLTCASSADDFDVDWFSIPALQVP